MPLTSSSRELGRKSGRFEGLAAPVDEFLSRVIGGRRAWASHALLAPAAAWLLFFLVCPLIMIFVMSFLSRGAYGAIAWRLTRSNYVRALTPAYFPVLMRSLVYAGLTTAFSLIFGYPVAYYLSFFAARRRGVLLLLLMVPFWTSCLIAIYSWIILLGRQGLINGLLTGLHLIDNPIQFLNTPFAVILGLVYFYIPLMILPLYGCLEKIPRSYIEASKDLGAGTWTTFCKVTLPLSLPGIYAGAILTFIPCVGDFLTADFLGGPKTYLIGNLIQNQFLGAQDWPFGGALATMLVAIFLTGLYVYLRLESAGVEGGRA